MKLARLGSVGAMLVVLLAACSHLPHMESTDSTSSLRQEYLEMHPDGKYNARIMKGEVVKGMGVIEVLASWGLPSAALAGTAARC